MKTLQFALCLLLPVAAVTFACRPAANEAAAPDPVRGRYLVERVGLCQDCHSPRDEKGRFIADKWLQGGPLPFQPTVPMPWSPVARPIAGLPTLSEAEAVRFLSTGELSGNRQILPPMPAYRFSAADARDIVAYLKHPLPPTPGTH